MNTFTERTIEKRHQESDYPIADFILQRSSPRAMSGEAIAEQDLMKLFEAARWAPSSYNRQPWNFVYSVRDSTTWGTYLAALEPSNREWCENAAALVVMVSDQYDPEDPSKIFKTASFDCGAAWENLCLQGVQDGLVVHGMEGFDEQKIKNLVALNPHQKVEMMFAIGRPDSASVLSERLQKKEKVSGRHELSDFVFKEKLKA